MAIPCPECGADVEQLNAEQVRAHSLDHWPEDIVPQAAHTEAIKRQSQLTDLYEDKRAEERRGATPGDFKGGY